MAQDPPSYSRAWLKAQGIKLETALSHRRTWLQTARSLDSEREIRVWIKTGASWRAAERER